MASGANIIGPKKPIENPRPPKLNAPLSTAKPAPIFLSCEFFHITQPTRSEIGRDITAEDSSETVVNIEIMVVKKKSTTIAVKTETRIFNTCVIVLILYTVEPTSGCVAVMPVVYDNA